MTTRKTTTLGYLGLGLVVGLTACYGGVQDISDQEDPLAADGGPAGDGADDGDPANADDEDPDHPFNVPEDEVRLLPFSVRMGNLANVTGVETSNPIFFELYALRYQLGDHDYSQLVAPDLRWSPQKMQNWVRGLVPVCESTVMRAKYPALVADPSPLIRDAFGRDATQADLEPLTDIAAAGYDSDRTFQLTCLAVLSSLDFVAR
jgi:hypothetical protein